MPGFSTFYLNTPATLCQSGAKCIAVQKTIDENSRTRRLPDRAGKEFPTLAVHFFTGCFSFSITAKNKSRHV
ncbi:MAG: hypothetical protein WAN10_11305, partial [Candidatus Acidiferrales bacterium]